MGVWNTESDPPLILYSWIKVYDIRHRAYKASHSIVSIASLDYIISSERYDLIVEYDDDDDDEFLPHC